MKKKHVRFHLEPKKSQQFDLRAALSRIAQQYTQCAVSLTPLIRSTEMSPIEAIILISTYADGMIAGAKETHTMSEDEILGAMNLLIRFWKKGLFTPGPDYPYTLEQTLQALQESEDGSEDGNE